MNIGLEKKGARLWAVGAAAIFSTVLASGQSAWAALATAKSDIECEDFVLGEVNVSYDDDFVVYGGPFQTDAVTKSHTVLGGMQITATATLKPKLNKYKFAWLQAVIDNEGGGTFLDPLNPLTGPWPDTPPGGYKHDRSIGDNPLNPPASTPFDQLPWYGNNKQGDLTLSDQPKNGVERTTGQNAISFESWLVCVEDVDQATKTYTVLPLLGFTWGYEFKLDQDKNGNSIVGDQINEYTGSTQFGGFVSSVLGPSGNFINGYAKYFTLRYLSATEENCEGCMVPIPVPAALPMGAVCLMLLGIQRWRQTRSRSNEGNCGATRFDSV